MTQTKGRRGSLLSLIALASMMVVGTACDKVTNGNGGGGSTKHAGDDNNGGGGGGDNGGGDNGGGGADVIPGNVDATWEMAVDFSGDRKSAAELKDLYDRLNENQRAELAEKKNEEGGRFVTMLVSGLVDDQVVTMLDHFMSNIDESAANLQVEAKHRGMSAFDIMRGDKRPVKEKADDAHKALAVFVRQNPKRVNDLVDKKKNFSAAKFNGVFTAAAALTPDRTDDIVKELLPENFDSWMDWAVGNRALATVPFTKFLAAGDDTRKASMRNDMLAAAFAAGPDELEAFVKDCDALTLSAGFATDSYKLRNRADNADFEGPILSVVAQRIADEDKKNPQYDATDLTPVANKTKEVLQDQYETYVKTEKFGSDSKTLVEILTASGMTQNEVKAALGLAADMSDITAELVKIGNMSAPKDRVVTDLFKTMIENYANDAKTPNLDALMAFTVQATDVPAKSLTNPGLPYDGVLRAGDRFSHVLARFVTDQNLYDVFSLIMDKVTDSAALLADDGAQDSVLRILCSNKRIGSTKGDLHNDTLALVAHKSLEADFAKVNVPQDMYNLLVAIEEKGEADDVIKIFKNAVKEVDNALAFFSVRNSELAKPAFNAAYTAMTDATRKQSLRSELVAAAFGKKDIDAVIALAKEANEWGLSTGFDADRYEIMSSSSPAHGSKYHYRGKFLYVVMMEMAEHLNTLAHGYTMESMREVSAAIKAASPQYMTIATKEMFADRTGKNNQTLMQGLTSLGVNPLSEERAKYVLNITDTSVLTVNDVFNEMAVLAYRPLNAKTDILAWLFTNAVDTDAKAMDLAMLDVDGAPRFIEALAALEATNETNTILQQMIEKMKRVDANATKALVLDHKRVSALARLADSNRSTNFPKEDMTQRSGFMVTLIREAGPAMIETLKSAADLDNVFMALDATKDPKDMELYCQGFARNYALRNNFYLWADKNRDVFKRALASADKETKSIMGSALLQRAYTMGPDELMKLVDESDVWGIRDGFDSDEYELMNDQDNTYSGSFHYVTALAMGDDVANDSTKWNIRHLGALSGKMKTILAGKYKNHVHVMKHGAQKETVFEGFYRMTHYSSGVCYFALQLDDLVTVEDVFTEADWHVTNDNGPEVLSFLYNAKVKTQKDAQDLAKLVNNDSRFIHLLSYMRSSVASSTMLTDFLSKLGPADATQMLKFRNGANRTAIRYLVDSGRSDERVHNGEDVAALQTMIATVVNACDNETITSIYFLADLNILLDAVLAKGVTADLKKVFAAIDNDLMRSEPGKGLGTWAYANRDKVLSDAATSKETIASLYSAEVATRHNMREMRHCIMEAAWNDAKIGDDKAGVVAAIKAGFLNEAALNAQDYAFFGNNDASRTLLFAVLFHTATVDHKGVTAAITQGDVQNLAKAFKSKLKDVDWNAVCAFNQNHRGGAHVWQLINAHIPSLNWADDAAAKTSAWLDYK